MWSNVANYIVELMLVTLAIYGGVFCPLRIISYLCSATGRNKSPEQKGSSSKRENLDNFLHQMDDSGLICLDTILGVVHIGRNVYWCRPRPEALF